MSCQDELDEMRRRTEFARQMGGAENTKRSHDGSKLTMRGRRGEVTASRHGANCSRA
jgi:acetyl-CoA carboxylase carboxyltransferase component